MGIMPGDRDKRINKLLRRYGIAGDVDSDAMEAVTHAEKMKHLKENGLDGLVPRPPEKKPKK